MYLRVIDLYFFFYSLPYRVLASPYKFHYSYISLMTRYILLVFHSSGESVFLNKNYKINKSLDFNTVLCQCISWHGGDTLKINPETYNSESSESYFHDSYVSTAKCKTPSPSSAMTGVVT